MPIYEYQCNECEHRLEALQKISDPPLTECPACAQPKLQKLVSAASFRLKGGGWYETDFKKEGRKQLAESDSDSKAGKTAAADDSKKADSKSAKASGSDNSGKAASSNGAGKAGTVSKASGKNQ